MDEQTLHTLQHDAIALLQQLIAIPSLSKEEYKTAGALEQFFNDRGVETKRLLNNVWCANKYFDSVKPTVLLNSHHDTVPANAQYTRDPFSAEIIDGKLYGLGSTDAGASLVSLAAAFIHFYESRDLSYNIVFAASAEEEISGKNGIEKLFATAAFRDLFLHKDSFAIVGEPTGLDLGVAEKGLLVLDCTATCKAGHAARDDGENAIYKAMTAINWLQACEFEKVSAVTGPVKMTVTAIQTENKAHNIIPGSCSFTVDIRLNECYTHEEILDVIRKHTDIDIVPRSTRLKPSFIRNEHPVVKAGIALGKKTYGSPTLSDNALIPLPGLKCGPGNSAQSHSADEFVAVKDIQEAIAFYVQLLNDVTGNEQ